MGTRLKLKASKPRLGSPLSNRNLRSAGFGAEIPGAIRPVIEQLEQRVYLSISLSSPNGSSTTQQQILSALPSGMSGVFASSGLQLSQSQVQGENTPDYVMLDPSPQLTSSGTLQPFSTSGPTGLTPAQILEAYGINQVMFGSIQGDGAGQTIAIIDAYDDPTIATDLQAFDAAFDLPAPPSLTKVNEFGGSTLPGTDPEPKGDDWEVEESLDVEWSHALAPDASILLIEANSPTNTDLIQNALTYATSVPGVVDISMSFGQDEFSGENALDSYFTTPAGHNGITFLASTGDYGEPGEYPAYSPNVMAVGGTTLNVEPNGQYISESGWSGSGGGISDYESQPAFQNGVVTQSSTQRTIPDISFDADPNTGVSIYDSYDFGTADPWIVVGGTSVAAPSWAAIVAIADQGMELSGGTSLNGATQTLPLLYKLAPDNFHDITTGSNGYPAGPGYDLVTGIGTPVANLLIPDLVQAANPSLHVISTTPALGASVFGAPPADFTLTLSSAADLSTLVGSDFAVNGSEPNYVSLDPTDTVVTLQYSTSPVTAGGTQTITVAAGAIDRLSDETPIEAYSGSFIYSPVQLQAVSSTPNSTSEMQLPIETMTVNFNEPVNPSSISTSDLTVTAGTVASAILQPGDLSIVFTLSGLTSEEYVTASIAAGALTDQYGASGAAFNTTFATHIATSALPAPTSVAPLGSQIYQTAAGGLIGVPSDTDNYTISLNPGQNLTVVVEPSTGTGGPATLRPSMTILNPSDSILATLTAGAAGQDAVIQTVPVSIAGTYTIIVGSDGTTTGQYSLSADLNAAVEAAEYDGPPDTTIGSAQDLDPAFNSINGIAGMASVLGALNVTTNDFYSATLTAGQVVTAAETNLSGSGTPTLTMLNSSGNQVAAGATGATNVNLDISGYVVPASGVYYFEVTGGSGTTYSLLVTKNAAFSIEPHYTFATAQNVTGVPEMVGYVGLGGGGTSETLSATDSGWWNSAGDNTATNTNYITGIYADQGYNSFYVFNLAGITLPISAAELELYNPGAGYVSSYANETLEFFDVSTPIATLEGGGSGDTSIYIDLGSGVSYGTNTVSAADNNTTIDTPLDTAAISAVTLAEGGQFAIGASLPLAIISDVDRYVFGGTSLAAGDVQLALTLGGGTDWYSVNVTSTSESLAFSTSTPSEGSGQFTNDLDPHIEIFDPNDNLVASGTKLADGRNEFVNYQPLETGTYRIEILAQNGTSGEYELNQGNALSLSLPATETKGAGAVTGTINVSSAPTSNLTITLTSSDPALLSVPSSVILDAGQSSIPLPMTVLDDHLLDGPQNISITATASGYFTASGAVEVLDNLPVTLSVSLPGNVVKGQGIVSGMIYSTAAPADNVVVQLTSSAPSELSVPATVTLLAGQTKAPFNATVLQDTLLDGTQNVTVGAAVQGWTGGSTSVAIADDNSTIAVTLPSSGWEGQSFTAGGTVTLGGTPLTSIVVNLSSSDPAELSVPATVTVAAGQTSATFNVSLINDGVAHGPLPETVTGAAAGLTSGTGAITVYDSTLNHITFASIAGPETAGTAFGVTLDAYNAENEVIAIYDGSLTLSATGAGGSEPVTPTTGTFSSGVWNGSVTLTTADPSVTLTAGSGGFSATSNMFAVQAGAVSTFTWNTISSPQIDGLPFSATVTAQDAYGNAATNFDGTATLSGAVGTVVSESMLGDASYPYTGAGGDFTDGYSFVPNTNIQVTAVRSYYGTNVSIWTGSGTLLVSQNVSGTPGQWTNTPLATPITLDAGDTYVIGLYNGGQTWYYTDTAPPNPTFATLGESLYLEGEGFPESDNGGYWPVDIQANVLTGASVPVSPTSATFVNGLWTGDVTVNQAESGMSLQVAYGGAQTASSNTFNVIVQSLTVGLPSDVEQNAGVVDGLLSVTPSPTSNLIVSLTSSDPSRLTVPSTLTILAGESSVTLPLTLVNTDLLLGLEQITISATAAGYASGAGAINVHDNQSAVLSVILPLSAEESAGTVGGMIISSAAPAENITIDLTSSNASQATVPATITLLADQTSANFNLTILNPGVIENSPTFVTVGAKVDNWIDGFGTIAVQNTDNFITLTLPASGWEGQTLDNAGTVTIGGTLANSLVVNLSSNDTSALSIPPTVTIPAGETSVSFNLGLLQDGVNAQQNVSVTAASSGLTSGNASISVYDSTPDYFAFNPITSPQQDAVGFPVTVDAYNIDNQIIQVYSGAATLSAADSNGALSISPASATFSSGVWTGNVTINGTSPSVTLTASAGAVTGVSNAFALEAGPVASFQLSPVGSPQTAGTGFTETITAEDVNGYTSPFNGTVDLSGLVGSSAAPTILIYEESEYNYFETALTDLGLSYTSFSTESAFDTALAAANPNSTLAIVDESDNYVSLTTAPAFISDGGRMILGYWYLTDIPSVASAFGASVYQEINTPSPVYNWGGSTFFNGISSPLDLENFVGYDYNGELLQPTASGTAVAGYSSTASSDEAAIIVSNSNRTILNGFLIDDGTPSTSAILLAENEIKADLPVIATPVPITPTTVTLTNGTWSGDVTVTAPAAGMFLEANDGNGHTGSSNTFNVLPAATAAPVLSPASDTGISDTDGITKLNNSSPATALTFIVGDTVSGATVNLYADGNLIGTATASGSTTDVTTNGDETLADGQHTITAIQTISGLESVVSSGETITIDTSTPVPTIATVSPNPRGTPVSSMTITFSEKVYGLTLSGLTLTDNGGPNLLTGSQTLTSSDGITWTLGNLSGITAAPGNYALSIAAGAAENTAGDSSAAATQAWQTLGAPTVTNVTVDGTAWNPAFLSYLATLNAANVNGYSIPTGSAQSLPLPWVNLNQINITFSQNVTISQSALQLIGVNVANYTFSNFSYNATTDTATWTLPQSIGDDNLALDLSGPAVSNSIGLDLDGYWNNGVSSYPSGDGSPGGNFVFDFSVLPGDVNQSGGVNVVDTVLVRNDQGSTPGTAGYSIFQDVYGSGGINVVDTVTVRNLQGSVLPTTDPVVSYVPAVQSKTTTVSATALLSTKTIPSVHAAAATPVVSTDTNLATTSTQLNTKSRRTRITDILKDSPKN